MDGWNKIKTEKQSKLIFHPKRFSLQKEFTNGSSRCGSWVHPEVLKYVITSYSNVMPPFGWFTSFMFNLFISNKLEGLSSRLLLKKLRNYDNFNLDLKETISERSCKIKRQAESNRLELNLVAFHRDLSLGKTCFFRY